MLNRAMELQVRKARPSDAARLADLAGQLGYRTTTAQMTKRLNQVLRGKKGVCFVATTKKGKEIAGWVHVSTTPLLEVESRAEINGLVVDESSRSQGTGQRLLEAAEKWAQRVGCKGMSVRSNVIRDRAHGFTSETATNTTRHKRRSVRSCNPLKIVAIPTT
jgi:GNAT superfamily N-acetyltransferase